MDWHDELQLCNDHRQHFYHGDKPLKQIETTLLTVLCKNTLSEMTAITTIKFKEDM